MRKLLTDVSESWRYPGGEIGVRAKGDCAGELLARIQSSDDLMRLLMYLDALDQAGGDRPDSVFIPYLPYARQDRVATDGDPFAIGALASILATAEISEVSSLDVHSDVASEAFLAHGIKLESISPVRYLAQFLLAIGVRAHQAYFVAPDAGAAEKVALYAEDLLVQSPVIQCEKLRDPTSGKLSGFRVDNGPSKLPEGSSLIVVDDICDGGGTFVGVASALAAHFNWHHPLYLFTTHGIYSHPEGLFPLTYAGYRTIGSTDSFLHGKTDPNLITISI